MSGEGAPAQPSFLFDRAAEAMARRDLAALACRRLKRSLARAYERVPHYRRRFDEADVTPDAIGTLADIAEFPLTEKADLRDNYPFGMFAVPPHPSPAGAAAGGLGAPHARPPSGEGRVIRLHASSGTTGKPTVVGYTRADLDLWADLMARTLACIGARPGDIVHNAYGYGLFTGGLGFHYGAERLGCTVVPASGGSTERQAMLLADFGANVLCATPSYALNIAGVAQEMGIDLRPSPLRLGAFGAEPWSEPMRRDLEERLGLKAMDIYGLSEILGPGIAGECGAQNGLHGWEDHFLFEVIDPQTLKVMPMGGEGELVITTLTKEALPLVRYRTRDITRLCDEPCECGRTHVRIMRVAGRDDDMLIIRGVNVYPSQIEAVLVGFPGLAPHYRIVLARPRDGPLDAITIEVERLPDAPGDEAACARAAGEVRHHVKAMVGVTCEVAVKAPGEVPRSDGKAVRVVDLRRR